MGQGQACCRPSTHDSASSYHDLDDPTTDDSTVKAIWGKFKEHRIVVWIRSVIFAALSYMLVYSVVSEVLLLIDVYSHHDPKFMALSCTFLVCPLLFVSLMMWQWGANGSWDRRNPEKTTSYYLYRVPIFNLVLVPSYMQWKNDGDTRDAAAHKFMDSFLTMTMTFPLYVINLSFLLEKVSSYSEVPLVSKAQLVFSVLTLAVNPIFYTYKQTSNDEDSFGFKHWVVTSLLFIPLVLIEIIHFFPFCFSYYVDATVTGDDLINILLIFNVPKIIFCAHVVYILAHMFFDGVNRDDGAKWWFMIWVILSMFMCITVPLVFYVTFTDYYSKDAGDEKRYKRRIVHGVLVLYLFISYGTSCWYLIDIAGWSALSVPVQEAIIAVICLVTFITLSFSWLREFMDDWKVSISPHT